MLFRFCQKDHRPVSGDALNFTFLFNGLAQVSVLPFQFRHFLQNDANRSVIYTGFRHELFRFFEVIRVDGIVECLDLVNLRQLL